MSRPRLRPEDLDPNNLTLDDLMRTLPEPLADFMQADEATRERILSSMAKPPHELTQAERQRSLDFMKASVEEQIQYEETRRSMGPAYEGFFDPLPEMGFYENPLPRLPDEFNTRARQIHDKIHELVLDHWPQIALYQHSIHNALRLQQEYELQIEVATILNAVSLHLTGRPRFLISDEFTISVEEQFAKLEDLGRRKPTLHAQVVILLVYASRFERPPHVRGCTCPICAHIARSNQVPGSSGPFSSARMETTSGCVVQ